VMHSSNLEARKAEFGRAKTKYIVGASKAAIDVIRNLDPRDESICWVHRGHVIFFNRDAMESDDSLQAMHQPWPPERIAGTATANTALKHQHFGPYEKMLLSTGKGHRVGAPHASQPQSRGGVEDEATIAHARRFLPRQRIMSSFYCEDGALHIACEDGSTIKVTPEDAVCLCTGQRAGHGDKYYERCAEMNKDGFFTVLPCSGTGPMAAAYTSHLVISYLDGGRPTTYSSGELSTNLHALAVHMQGLPDRGAWALYMAYLGGMQADVCETIFPTSATGAGDLGACYHWFTDWYGEDMDPRSCFAVLAGVDVAGSPQTSQSFSYRLRGHSHPDSFMAQPTAESFPPRPSRYRGRRRVVFEGEAGGSGVLA